MEKEMHPNSMSENRCLRTPDAAAYIGLSKSTLEKLRVTGGGPEYSALGRVIVYRIEDLDAWVLSHKRRSTSETRPNAG